MKVIFLLLAFWTNISFGQLVDKKKLEIAKTFLHFVAKGQKDSSWQLFDKINVPDVTEEQFGKSVLQIENDLLVFDTFELSMSGVKSVNGKQFDVYTFRAISKTRNIVDDILIDISFFSSSQLVGGIQPKKLLKENAASTAKGKETTIEKEFTAVIDNITYKITGINIVHFENKQGLLAIQVESALPSGANDAKVFANKEALKFAKYLVSKGYVEKATLKAKELDLKLLDDIGVSFLDPGTHGGYNVMVKAADLK
ncbi:MAG: hypothetical protein ABJB86_02790 [Bacteroidota bacterium]